MLMLTPQMRVFIGIEPADFRSGINGLSRLCRARLGEDPFSGAVFVFRNRARTAIKLLVYDGQGFCLLLKRFSQGRLKWWPTVEGTDARSAELASHQLQILLWNGNPPQAAIPGDWRRVLPEIKPEEKK